MFRDKNNVYFKNSNKDYKRTKINLKELEKQLLYTKNCLKKYKNSTISNKYAKEEQKRLETKIRFLEKQITIAKSTGIIHKGLKPKTKKRSNDWIEKQIMKIIENDKPNYLQKEEIARILEVQEYQIEQVFRTLNLKGILHQPIHHALHDSKRDPNGLGLMGWAGDLYYIRKNNLNERKDFI